MFSSAEKTKPAIVQRQQQTAGAAFFRKAGDETFFGSEKQSSFFSPAIQTKLTVSSPDDPQEKEADAVAERVMRMPEPVAVQPKEEEKKLERKEDNEEKLQAKLEIPVITVQRKCEHCEKEEKVQAKLYRMIQRSEESEEADTSVQAKQIGLYRSDIFKQSGRGPPLSSPQPSFEQGLSSSKGSGSPMSQNTQQFMGSRFNADFSGVRIHTGSYAQSLSSSINAQAFAHGSDIYFNSGKYSPNTEAGGTLLAHELTHTIQQGASPVHSVTNVAGKPVSSHIAQTKREQVNTSPQNHQHHVSQAEQWRQAALLQKHGRNIKLPPAEEADKRIRPMQRKEENDFAEDTTEVNVQQKTDMSNWHVDAAGCLQTAQPVMKKNADEKELQKKEEELKREEEEGVSLPGVSIQQKSLVHNDASFANVNQQADQPLSQIIQTKADNNTGEAIHRQNNTEQQISAILERGPPLVQCREDDKDIHRSIIDDAVNFVSSSSLLGCISIVNPSSTGPCLLEKARDVALHIPGYRALRVVLGNDPITGEHIERNGHNFIEAAFDIMPGGMNLHQKLQEQGQLDAAAAWIDGRIAAITSIVAALTGSFSRFWNSLSIDRLSSPMEVIREGAGIVLDFISSITQFAIDTARQLLQMVKDFLLSAIVDFIKERTTAYPLLTVILGEDPVTKQPVARNGTNILNVLLELGGEEGVKQRTQMQDTGTFQRIVGYIDQGIAAFSDLYDTIVQNFDLIWSVVSIDALMNPVAKFTELYNVFAAPVQRVWDFVTTVGAEMLKLIKEVLMQRLSAWAREQRGYALVTVIIGKDPFTDAAVPFTMENVIKGFFSLMEGGEEQYNQLKESGAIDRTVAKITAAVARLNMTPQAIVQLFIDLWNSFSINDLVDPIAAFQRIIATFGEPIMRLVNFVIEIVKIVVEAILIVMNFPFDLINNIITRAMAAMDRIKRDPVAFLKNLLRAIKQGFIQFFDNILTHLLNGVVGWLMSELRDANIPALTDFSLRGVIGWVLQVLGISMEAIWAKLAAHPRIGPARVARIRSMISTLEGIWTFIRDVQERGMAAIWDKIQEQLSNLWDTVIDAVKNWIMEQIVNRVVARLLSMLDPTGIMAVVNSAIAIYSAIQSFIRYLREILEVINSFVNGVADIAEGNVTTAANYLERTMGRAMPIVIGFLANQVGLSGVGRRVGEMIERVREMVDNALTWLVNRAVDTGMNLIDRAMAMGRSARDAVLGFLGLRKTFNVREGESHSLYFDASSRRMMMASNPVVFGSFINTIVIPERKQIRLNPVKNNILNQLQQVDLLIANTAMPENVKQQQIQALLELIGPEIAELIRETSGVSLRSENPQYGGLHGGFGSSMRVRVVDGQPATTGGQPTVGGGNWDKLRKRKTSMGSNDTFYIRAHLLNDNLGGPGNNWQNLSILSQQANNRDWYGSGSHETAVESRLKGPLSEPGKGFIYVVTANYGRSLNSSLLNAVNDLIRYKTNPAASPPAILPSNHNYLNSYSVSQVTDVRDIINGEVFVPTSFVCTINEIDPSTGQNVSNSDHNINRPISNSIEGQYFI